MRAARGVATSLAIATAVAACGAEPAPEAVPPPDLDRALGVFAPGKNLTTERLRELGVSLVVRPGSESTSGLRADGIGLVDSGPQRQMYSAHCPRGRDSCRGLSGGERTTLLDRIDRDARRSVRRHDVVAWYLTDDNWLDLSKVLPKVRRTLRRAAPHTPTVCALDLPVLATGASEQDARRARNAFTSSLRNYSPSWCDSVLLYAYAPKGDLATSGRVDWSMSRTLDGALRHLQTRGFDRTRHTLIGTPQTFGRGQTPRDAPWTAPRPSELATQMSAFCAAGASSLITYAWHDPVPASTDDLSSNPAWRDVVSRFRRGCG